MVLKIPFHPNFYLSFALEIPYACTINKSTMGSAGFSVDFLSDGPELLIGG